MQRTVIQQYLKITERPLSQLSQQLIKNPDFLEIWSMVDSADMCPISADIDYVNMMIVGKQKEEESAYQNVAILEEVNHAMECQIACLEQKNQEIEKQNPQTSLDDIELLQHQNQRLREQLSQAQPHPTNTNQLHELLEKYHCEQFPKNKTQALKLIGKLELELQKLQVQQLTSK